MPNNKAFRLHRRSDQRRKAMREHGLRRIAAWHAACKFMLLPFSHSRPGQPATRGGPVIAG